jgi:hypothetical protein
MFKPVWGKDAVAMQAMIGEIGDCLRHGAKSWWRLGPAHRQG